MAVWAADTRTHHAHVNVSLLAPGMCEESYSPVLLSVNTGGVAERNIFE